MDILGGAFALRLARGMVFHLLRAMGDSVSDADWAGLFVEAMETGVRNDEFGWCGICRGEAYYRTVSVWNPCPHQVKHVRLISGRNSLDYSFDIENVHTEDPNQLGEMVLGIWNARITDVRKKFATTRTVVLIKGEDLSMVSVFEEEALKYLPEEYEWEWNQRGNLEGYVKGTDIKKFTWQPHGSQFTITTNVSDNRLKIRIRHPPLFDRESVLAQLKFDPSWIEIVK